MTRQPVLIASDLDGTIVCGGREIPRRTEEALRRFVRNAPSVQPVSFSIGSR